MKFKKTQDIDGTYLIGEIVTTYGKLVSVFGKPHSNGDGYKVDAEWAVRFDDGTVASIYNWEDGPNYCGAEGTPVKKIMDWHVGGRSADALVRVNEVLAGEV